MSIAIMSHELNILAALVAALSSFAVGALWYGPLFGKAWMEAFNISEADIAQGNMPMIYGLAFVLSFIAAGFLDVSIGSAGFITGLLAGLTVGAAWVAAFTGIQYLFEGRSLKAFLINAGYSVVSLTVMGTIVGAF